MKKILRGVSSRHSTPLKAIAFAILLSPASVLAHLHYCSCDAGAAVGCVAGNDANDGLTPATARKTFSKYITDWKAWNQSGELRHCQGGAWKSTAQTVASGGNLNNANATRLGPIVTTTYDASAVWSGGAGIRPKWIQGGNFVVLDIGQGTVTTARNGYQWHGIEIDGEGTNTSVLVRAGGSHNHLWFNNMELTRGGGGLQCNGGVTSAPFGGDSLALSEHFKVTNSAVTYNTNGILSTCNDTQIEGSTWDHNAENGLHHHIYIGGNQKAIAIPTIASIVGNGSTVTVTTTAAHNISSILETCATISGVTGGTGSWNITCGTAGSTITVTASNKFTYVATANGTGSGGSITSVRQVVPARGILIRDNTLTNASVGAPGSCLSVAIVMHGDWENVLIERNDLEEPTAPASSQCWGISLDSGNYSPPEAREKFRAVVIRYNRVRNFAQGIGVDMCGNCMLESNYVYSTFANAAGVVSRSKNFAPTTVGSSTLPTYKQQPDGVTARYNTVHLTNPSSGGRGIALNNNVGDARTGRNHGLYGNLVVLGSTATTAAMCYDTRNVDAAWFVSGSKDHNACYYLSVAVPKWDGTSSLAAVQGAGTPTDASSTMAFTASVTTGQPFFTNPGVTPAIGTSSAAKNTGHPSLCSHLSYGGILRNQGRCDRGAYEYGGTTVAPNSQGVRAP